MVALLSPRAGALALDVATGGGHTANALRAAGCRVVTTDATLAMRPDIACDAQRMPLRDARFDVVASRIAPHHFPDLPAFAREAARVLRSGGALYVFDLTTPEDAEKRAFIDGIERLRDPSHVASWPASAWRRALDEARLRIERLDATSSTFELEPWVARARMDEKTEAELRRRLDARPAAGGYGLTDEGKMRVLRVEIVARKATP